MRLTLSLLCLCAMVAGCSNSQDTAALLPDWVLQSPVKPGHYIGIGSASKLVHPLDADAVAKQHALDNLSREIRVQVQSTSTTRTLQVNEWLSESFTYSSRARPTKIWKGSPWWTPTPATQRCSPFTN